MKGLVTLKRKELNEMKRARGTIKIVNENRKDNSSKLNILTNIAIFLLTFTLSISNIFDLPTLSSENKHDVETIEVTDEVIAAYHGEIPKHKMVVRNNIIPKTVSTKNVKISGGITEVFETMDDADFKKMEELTREPDISDNIYVPIKEERNYNISEKEYEILCKVVEAEVEGDKTWYNRGLTYDQLLKAKIRVAQVFLNRTFDNKSFKSIDSLYESLTQKNASSTFNDGRYYKVTVRDITKEAVYRALLRSTPDYTGGALFFSSGNGCSKYGTLTLTDEVGHSFYNPYL